VVIHVAAGALMSTRFHLVFAATGDKPAALFTRSLVVVEKGARAMLVESHEGDAARDYQSNTALELAIADEAHVDHIRFTREGAKALHVSSLMADVGAHARFNSFVFTTGGAVVRNQLFLAFCGRGHGREHPRARRLLKDKQHSDITMVADHSAVGCQAREVFKSVLDDSSRGIFQGKIIVPARRAADRRENGLACADALRRRRGRQQAGAGDFRRRRAVRPWRDRGRSRRGSSVLSACARHSTR